MTVEPTAASLPAVRSIYTGPGRFTEGRVSGARWAPPPGCVEPSNGFPLNWEMTAEGAAAVRAGELEHCRDIRFIADVIDYWANAINRHLAGRRFANDAAVTAAARRRGIPTPADMQAVVLDLFAAFDQRDARGYHDGPAVPGTWFTAGSRCSVTIRIGRGATPRVGALSTRALFSGLGAPAAVLRRY